MKIKISFDKSILPILTGTSLLGFYGVGLLSGQAAEVEKAGGSTRPPNILVIYTDDQAYNAIGYRNPEVLTPNLDRLAADGVRFDRAFTTCPLCLPARASVLTGAYPQQHGGVALHLGRFNERVIRKNEFKTLPKAMNEIGYHTAFHGKSHLGDPKTYGFVEGAETKDVTDPELLNFTQQFFQSQAHSDRPFFLWLAPHKPHIVLRPPQKFLDLYAGKNFAEDPNFRIEPPMESLYNQAGEKMEFRDSKVPMSTGPGSVKGLMAGPPRTQEDVQNAKRLYYAVVSHLDDEIGQVIEQLKAAGLYENTVIIYLSDNGYFLGNHGLGNKVTLHEESVRVPMFIHSPQIPKKGGVSEALVSDLDIYPTILELAGQEPPSSLMGRSLRPLLDNPDAPFRDHIISESAGVPETRLGTGHRMVRTDRYKYILTTHDEEAFFDLQVDPFEMTNLIKKSDLKDEIERHRSLLKDWQKQVGEKRIPYSTVSQP
jgi:arylsulfatase A-like enzyme